MIITYRSDLLPEIAIVVIHGQPDKPRLLGESAQNSDEYPRMTRSKQKYKSGRG